MGVDAGLGLGFQWQVAVSRWHDATDSAGNRRVADSCNGPTT